MLTLTDVKHALRIDSNIDDAYLDRLMRSADDYLRSAITDYDELRKESAQTELDGFNEKADIVQLSMVADLYEKHRGGDDSKKKMEFSSITRFMLNQLQYTRVKNDG